MTGSSAPTLLPPGSGAVARGQVRLPAPRLPADALPERRSWSRPSAPRLAPPPPERPPVAVERPREVLLNLLAVVGLVTTGVTVVAAASGLQPMVVRSGSMEPAIATGAVVLVREVRATELRVGDVAAVVRPDRVRVAHRVLAVRREGGVAVLTLKGDANREPDPEPVVAARASRVVGSLPLAGRAASELTSARGGFVLGCLVTAVARRSRRRQRP